jgi:hypothetical protein
MNDGVEEERQMEQTGREPSRSEHGDEERALLPID